MKVLLLSIKNIQWIAKIICWRDEISWQAFIDGDIVFTDRAMSEKAPRTNQPPSPEISIADVAMGRDFLTLFQLLSGGRLLLVLIFLRRIET